ncbi:S-adenosyl-L-methionine-dependent methyltransferase [Phytophthora cactorum]|nr:S-adenosyl-L-methionine-dependent methyltransferase [Phytophthora cactorum]
MLAAIQPLSARDVFIGVGAGIGNFLAQVALTASVIKRICVEVRNELNSLATQHMQRHIDVVMKAKDVRDGLLSVQAPTSEATIIFANYFFFEEEAKLVVTRERCAMPKSPIVAATSRFSPGIERVTRGHLALVKHWLKN